MHKQPLNFDIAYKIGFIPFAPYVFVSKPHGVIGFAAVLFAVETHVRLITSRKIALYRKSRVAARVSSARNFRNRAAFAFQNQFCLFTFKKVAEADVFYLSFIFNSPAEYLKLLCLKTNL